MAQDTNRSAELKQGRVWLIAILITAIVGIAISVELSRIHYYTHTDPSFDSVCAINERVNCEQVARSPYSVFLFMPISLWGLVAYLALGALAIAAIRSGRRQAGFGAGLLFAASLASVAVAGLLAWISHFIIDSLCIFCMSLYVVNLALLVFSALLLRSARRNPIAAFIADVRALPGDIRTTLALVATVAIPVALIVWLLPTYWRHLGWKDIPALPTGTDDYGAHWVGAVNPVLTVYEYSDYQCPHCRHAHKKARAMIARYADRVRLVHKHFPVDHACNPAVTTLFHDRACEFSRAVECAASQNRFWEMNDALFAIQDMIRPAAIDLGRLAVEIGLDKRRFDACMKSDEVMKRISAEIEEGIYRKVKGTPTFLIGAQPYPGGFSEEVLRNALKTLENKNTP